jgi:hypothetical protein
MTLTPTVNVLKGFLAKKQDKFEHKFWESLSSLV